MTPKNVPVNLLSNKFFLIQNKMQKEKIVLNGQAYAAPKTESVEIINQGVLCALGGGRSSITSFTSGGSL